MENIKERFIKATIKSIKDIFSTMVLIDMAEDWESKAFAFSPDSIPKGELTGVIGIAGRLTGSISIVLTKQLAMQIASVLLEEELTTLCDDVYEALSEISNMVAGGIKTALTVEEPDQIDVFELSIPTVMDGEITYYPPYVIRIVIPINTKEATFYVSAFIKEIDI